MQELKRKKRRHRAYDGEPRHQMHKCMPCGYVYDDASMEPMFDELGDDYRCPLCNARLDAFVRFD